MRDIPGFSSFAKIEPVKKGWSDDEKYYIETGKGDRLLLRLTDAAKFEEKKFEFGMMRRVHEMGVPMSRPLDFGLCGQGKRAYSLFTWCDGEDAERVLPAFSKREQYHLGVQAGRVLRAIHSIPAPETQEDWAVRFNRKANGKIQKYLACPLRFEGDQAIIEYLEINRALLDNRPQCYQHGDYHVGNMIISHRGELSIIDFNRHDFGDPWEEFNRIVWSASVSPEFATGQIDGYFDGNPPELFFRLLMYYIGGNMLSSIYWAIPFGEEEVQVMMRQSQEVLGWFGHMKSPAPTWYLSDLKR